MFGSYDDDELDLIMATEVDETPLTLLSDDEAEEFEREERLIASDEIILYTAGAEPLQVEKVESVVLEEDKKMIELVENEKEAGEMKCKVLVEG